MNSCRCLLADFLSLFLFSFFPHIFCWLFWISFGSLQTIFILWLVWVWSIFSVIFVWFFRSIHNLALPIGINFSPFCGCTKLSSHNKLYLLSNKNGYCTKALVAFNCTKRPFEANWRKRFLSAKVCRCAKFCISLDHKRIPSQLVVYMKEKNRFLYNTPVWRSFYGFV